MNGLDRKTVLIGSLKIRQQKYLKVIALVLLIIFNFRLDPALQAEQNLLSQEKSQNKHSFVSKALNISGGAVVTIETERKVEFSRETIIPPEILNDPYFERFFGLRGLPIQDLGLKKVKGVVLFFLRKVWF